VYQKYKKFDKKHFLVGGIDFIGYIKNKFKMKTHVHIKKRYHAMKKHIALFCFVSFGSLLYSSQPDLLRAMTKDC